MQRVTRVEGISPRNTSPILKVVEAIIQIVAGPSSCNIPVFTAGTFWSLSSMKAGTALVTGQRTILQSQERAAVGQRSFTTRSREHVIRLLSRMRRQPEAINRGAYRIPETWEHREGTRDMRHKAQGTVVGCTGDESAGRTSNMYQIRKRNARKGQWPNPNVKVSAKSYTVCSNYRNLPVDLNLRATPNTSAGFPLMVSIHAFDGASVASLSTSASFLDTGIVAVVYFEAGRDDGLHPKFPPQRFTCVEHGDRARNQRRRTRWNIEENEKRLTEHIHAHPGHVKVEPEPIQSISPSELTMQLTDIPRSSIPVRV